MSVQNYVRSRNVIIISLFPDTCFKTLERYTLYHGNLRSAHVNGMSVSRSVATIIPAVHLSDE